MDENWPVVQQDLFETTTYSHWIGREGIWEKEPSKLGSALCLGQPCFQLL